MVRLVHILLPGDSPPTSHLPTSSPRPTSMASDLAVSCRSRSAIWLAEVSSSSCREFWRCCTSFSSRRISRSLEARAASSRGPEHRAKFTLSWAQTGAWRGREVWGRGLQGCCAPRGDSAPLTGLWLSPSHFRAFAQAGPTCLDVFPSS